MVVMSFWFTYHIPIPMANKNNKKNKKNFNKPSNYQNSNQNDKRVFFGREENIENDKEIKSDLNSDFDNNSFEESNKDNNVIILGAGKNSSISDEDFVTQASDTLFDEEVRTKSNESPYKPEPKTGFNTDSIIGALGILGIGLLIAFVIMKPNDDNVKNPIGINNDENEELQQEIDRLEKEVNLAAKDLETISGEKVVIDNNLDQTTTLDNSAKSVPKATTKTLKLNVKTDVKPEAKKTTVNSEITINNKSPQPEATSAKSTLDKNVNSKTEKKGFFQNLFNRDKNKTPNVGGSLEDPTINSENDKLNEAKIVVKSGDNVWNLLIGSGATEAEAAGIINALQNSDMTKYGITSGSADLIYPNQVLDIGGMMELI